MKIKDLQLIDKVIKFTVHSFNKNISTTDVTFVDTIWGDLHIDCIYETDRKLCPGNLVIGFEYLNNKDYRIELNYLDDIIDVTIYNDYTYEEIEMIFKSLNDAIEFINSNWEIIVIESEKLQLDIEYILGNRN